MLRVMLVDDSHEELVLLEEGLRAAGFDVVMATAAALALPERIAALEPDVIIIGTESPTRDVLEHISVMTAHNPRPIVLFTEDRAQPTIQAALKAGVSAYVVAGIQADRLQPILDVALARFEQERELREELHAARSKLADRKVIDRAKGILMAQKRVTEDEAYRLLRKLAMDRNAKLLDVAQQVIDVARLLG